MLERPLSKDSPDVQWLRCINYYCQTSHTPCARRKLFSFSVTATYSLVPPNDMTFHQSHYFLFLNISEYRFQVEMRKKERKMSNRVSVLSA